MCRRDVCVSRLDHTVHPGVRAKRFEGVRRVLHLGGIDMFWSEPIVDAHPRHAACEREAREDIGVGRAEPYAYDPP
jgi:hypothetical protein